MDKNVAQIYLDHIVANIPHYVFWKDLNLVYLGCNENFARVAGLNNSKEIIGKTDNELPWAEMAEAYRKEDLEIINQNIFLSNKELPLIKENGEQAIISVSKVPLRDNDNNVIGVLGIYTDITDRKAAEKQLADALQAKSTFLNIVSHEIKGPLANIAYISKILKDDIENDQIKKDEILEYINTEIKDANRGVEIINYLQKFLNLDEPQSNKISTLNLRKELIELMSVFEDSNEKNLSFHLIKDENVSRSVILNRNVFEIIKILLSNAVKYSKKNGEIKVRFEHSNVNSKNYLRFSVEDNGKGINENLLKNLFTPLLSSMQIQSYNAPAIKLSYAKKLIEFLEGTLDIKSTEAEGTQVTIAVPYENSNQEVYFEMGCFDEEQVVKPFKRRLKFLIVEDNPVTAELLKAEVLKFRHHVDTACSAVDAYKYIKAKKYDVLFMDISLPGTNGVELIENFHQLMEHKPIMIAVTSHNNEKDIDFFMEQGFATVINKPFTREEIFYCVETIQTALTDGNNAP